MPEINASKVFTEAVKVSVLFDKRAFTSHISSCEILKDVLKPLSNPSAEKQTGAFIDLFNT